jgi:pimeloyl-ACP methyl ester carboxylesterase
MGLGMQLVDWPEALVSGLVAAGHCVICYDNRDIGLSTHIEAPEPPRTGWPLLRQKLGWGMVPPYTLQDMACDAIGLLDALRIPRAHLLGVSMGGMVSQRVAATWPARVLSLTSIMSSSGAPELPGTGADLWPPASAEALNLLGQSGQGLDLAAFAAQAQRLFEGMGGGLYDSGGAEGRAHLQRRLTAGAQRDQHPAGVVRQTLAVLADRDRYTLLPQIACPTLVIHGTADPLVPLACGQDTASRIPGARFEAIEGMGHDWPPAVVRRWLALLLPHLAAATPR